MIPAGLRLRALDVATLRRIRVPDRGRPVRPGEWAVRPNAAEVPRALPKGAALRLGLASSQHAVGLGQLTRSAARGPIVVTLLRAIGYLPEDCRIEMCTCHPGQDCACRKAASDHAPAHPATFRRSPRADALRGPPGDRS